ncbi:hypothetical protein J3E72DRAFT_329956, partial [Bipolaris maydis]|uniref:uncharacterized protein n=1 Tax=Cochliobolus heterostrophus TaxID=5016 RepID=UPI0024D34B4C
MAVKGRGLSCRGFYSHISMHSITAFGFSLGGETTDLGLCHLYINPFCLWVLHGIFLVLSGLWLPRMV